MQQLLHRVLSVIILTNVFQSAYAEDTLTIENSQTNTEIYVKHEHTQGPAFDSVLPHADKSISRDEILTACKQDLVCKINFTYLLPNSTQHLLGSIYLDLGRIPMRLVDFDVSYESAYQLEINMENNHIVIVPRYKLT